MAALLRILRRPASEQDAPAAQSAPAKPSRSGTYPATWPREPVDVLLEDFLRECHGDEEHVGAERIEGARDEHGDRITIPDV